MRGTLALLLALALPPVGSAQGYAFSIEPHTFAYLGAGRTVLWNGATAPADDNEATVAIGFPFEFQGRTYTSVTISSNGYLTFGGETGTRHTNGDLPDGAAPDGMICPWWDDLRVVPLGATDQVAYESFGIPGFRTLTVEWSSVSRFGDTASGYSFLNFQVSLRELQDRITFSYGTYGQFGAPADSTATVGIEHPGGTRATEPFTGNGALGIADWPTNMRIDFWPPQSGDFSATVESVTYAALGGTRSVVFDGATGEVDDNFRDIALGFSFQFYGQTHTTLRVSTNGYATFPVTLGTYWDNTPIPDPVQPNNLIAPWWDDLKVADLGQTDEISYFFDGFLPGARRLIVEWRSLSLETDTTGGYHSFTFQLHLLELGNRMEIHYGPSARIGSPAGAPTASMGIEDNLGTTGIPPFGSTSLHPFADFPPLGTALVFEPALLCGDCNGDGTVSVTDALLAAQSGVGLVALTGLDFTSCNVAGLAGASGAVDVVDALLIARYDVGLESTLACTP